MGLPADLAFATKGELAVQVLREAYADGMDIDFACGDEVYGSRSALRTYLEEQGQGYVLRVPKTFTIALTGGITLTCAKVVTTYLKARRNWEVVSAAAGSKGERDYAWAWIATADPRHWLLIRRHLATGECAYHYCHVPAGQPASLRRLITAAGLRWPVEEGFEFGKDYFGLDQSQVRLYTAIARHTVLVTAALAICAIAAAQARRRTDTQARPPASQPASPDSLPPRRSRPDPAHRRRDQTPAQRRHRHTQVHLARRTLVPMAAPPPSPRPLVPQTRPARPPAPIRPGQTVKCGCRTTYSRIRVRLLT